MIKLAAVTQLATMHFDLPNHTSFFLVDGGVHTKYELWGT